MGRVMRTYGDFRTIAAIGRDAGFWRTRPSNSFVRDGFEVLDRFLPRSECERLVGVADDLLARPGALREGSCYVVPRRYGKVATDQRVAQLMNVQDADPGLREMALGERVAKLYQSRLGAEVVVETISLQVDDPDTATKRDWHVDTLRWPTFKAFIYLTDVESLRHGPFTVFPGSHRDYLPKVGSTIVNSITNRTATDMRFVPTGAPRHFLGTAGTCILSTQSLVHKGWHEHDQRRRYMIIVYVSLARFSRRGLPFTLGRESAEAYEIAVQDPVMAGAADGVSNLRTRPVISRRKSRRDAQQAAWVIYKTSGYTITQDEINQRLTTWGFDEITTRTYGVLQKLRHARDDRRPWRSW